MRRVAIEKQDGTLVEFEDGRPVTFKRVADATLWLAPGERLRRIDVPDDHVDALVSGVR